jgi:hypothetical protein
VEWLEGVTLYEWAEQSKPTNEEQLWVLAQVARGLESTHSVDGVHRDVKGDNIRVCFNGRRAVLMGFGAGCYLGAARLTREGLPPGTDAYRSPEAWRYELSRPRHSMERYEATPADDVFALGVSAYRMVTGAYPPPAEMREEDSGPERLRWTQPPAPRELNPRVDAKLSALIRRMLSERPQERPPAGELALALEEATAELRRARTSEAAPSLIQHARELLRGHVPTWARYVACVMQGGVLATAVAWRQWPEGQGSNTQLSTPAGGISWAGLGDTGGEGTGASESPSSRTKAVAKPVPEEPMDGQRRAPRCRPPVEIAINEGCWIAVQDMKPPCPEPSYEWKGRCYIPSASSPSRPVSEPP